MTRLTVNTIERLLTKLYKKGSDFNNKHGYYPDAMSETLYWVYGTLIFRTWNDYLEVSIKDENDRVIHVVDITMQTPWAVTISDEYNERLLECNIDKEELISAITNM